MSKERACGVDELPEPDEAIEVYVGGEAFAIARDSDGGLHAVSGMCTHAMVSLAEGEIEDCQIECWLHGSRFDLRTGEPTGPPAVTPVDVYAVTVEGDDVLIDTSRTIGEDNAKALASKEN
jgi:3-phenylpropionate/trans-cinnamate dioxygenase ferredoxin subunit